MEQLGLEASSYEGPTGIVGVLHDSCRTSNVDSASLWAAVPSYAPSMPSPKAALALVERTTDLVGAAVGIDDLMVMTEAYEERLTELVDEDEATAEYVTQLEEEFDSQQFDDELKLGTGDGLVEEVERYLREQDESIGRYQKFYEASIDTPDRIDAVAAQMGWSLEDWTEEDTEAIPTKLMEAIFQLITWERDGWPSAGGNEPEAEPEFSPPPSKS
jgi:hypothetical protein